MNEKFFEGLEEILKGGFVSENMLVINEEVSQHILEFTLESYRRYCQNQPRINFSGQESVTELFSVNTELINELFRVHSLKPLAVEGYIPDGYKFYKKEEVEKLLVELKNTKI